MRRITTWALSTITALVLLFSYHTSTSSTASGVVALGSANANGGTGSAGAGGTSGQGRSSGSTSSGSGATSTATPTPSPSESSPGSGSSGSGSSSGDGAYLGDAVMTRFGPVQVQITVSNGKVTRSVVTQVPWNDPRDQEINSYAVPVLNDEVVQAQSSQIDMVSGATYTSEGYIQSLQSALDRASL